MGYESEIKKLEVRWEDNPKQYFAPLADAYRKNGDYEKAIELINDGLAERPNYVSAYIVMGRTRVGMGEHDEASRVFEKVLEFDGENIIALNQLAELAEETDDLGGAIRWLRRLLEVDPMNQAAARLQQLEEAAGASDAPAAGASDAPPGQDEGEADAAEGEGISFADVFSDETAQSDESAEIVGEIAPAAPDENEATAALVEKEDIIPPETDGVEVLGGRRPALDEIETVVDMMAVVPPSDESSEEIDETPVSEAGAEETIAIEPAGQDDPADEAGIDEEAEVATLQMAGISDEAIAEAGGTDAADEVLESDDQPVEMIEPAEPVESADETARTDEESGEPVLMEEGASPEPASDEEIQEERRPRISRSLQDIPVIIPDDVSEDALLGISPGADDPSPEPVVTETMAQVFAQQGMVEQAKQVYEQLLEAQPGNESLQAEIGKLDSMAQTRPRPQRVARCSVIDTGGNSSRNFLKGILATVVSPDSAMPDPVQPFSGPDEAPSPRSRLSFDDFYGAAGPQATFDEPNDENPDDEDFKSWLKGLKS